MAADVEKYEVTVEAVKFEGGVENAVEILQWMQDNGAGGSYLEPVAEYSIGDEHQAATPELLVVNTSRGNALVNVGEYVIHGPEDTFYVKEPQDFAKEYRR